jgi:N-acetylglutamate synthase-like GNAT family acetyltransferase
MAGEVTLRPAGADDQQTIRRMVHASRLDPFFLRWQHFMVAELGGEIVGIGQIRPYHNCPELGSLVVREAYRGRGIGGMIVRALLARADGPVYLECAERTRDYYVPFGFVEIPWQEAPFPLRLKSGLATLLGGRIVVMRYE